MTIWKFQLQVTDEQTILMPKGSEVLCVQMQNSRPCLWVKCQDRTPGELRKFIIVGTGHPLPERASKYVGTVQDLDGVLVWHVFDAGAVSEHAS